MRSYFRAGALAVTAAAAGAALVTGPAATAATPSCGSSCVAPYVQSAGPKFGLDVYKRAQAVGQPVILFARSNQDPAQDFGYSEEGTVNDFEAAGLVSKAVALQYGKLTAWEIEYAPYGADTGLCAGIAGGGAGGITGLPFNGDPVSLQPCGESADTVWIALPGKGWFQAINGATSSFSHPFVLTYPSGASPTDLPRPQLSVHTLQTFAGGAVYDNQDWRVHVGVQP